MVRFRRGSIPRTRLGERAVPLVMGETATRGGVRVRAKRPLDRARRAHRVRPDRRAGRLLRPPLQPSHGHGRRAGSGDRQGLCAHRRDHACRRRQTDSLVRAAAVHARDPGAAAGRVVFGEPPRAPGTAEAPDGERPGKGGDGPSIRDDRRRLVSMGAHGDVRGSDGGGRRRGGSGLLGAGDSRRQTSGFGGVKRRGGKHRGGLRIKDPIAVRYNAKRVAVCIQRGGQAGCAPTLAPPPKDVPAAPPAPLPGEELVRSRGAANLHGETGGTVEEGKGSGLWNARTCGIRRGMAATGDRRWGDRGVGLGPGRGIGVGPVFTPLKESFEMSAKQDASPLRSHAGCMNARQKLDIATARGNVRGCPT